MTPVGNELPPVDFQLGQDDSGKDPGAYRGTNWREAAVPEELSDLSKEGLRIVFLNCNSLTFQP